jgi:hypothetical protein
VKFALDAGVFLPAQAARDGAACAFLFSRLTYQAICKNLSVRLDSMVASFGLISFPAELLRRTLHGTR